jgi:hypothetical protein
MSDEQILFLVMAIVFLGVGIFNLYFPDKWKEYDILSSIVDDETYLEISKGLGYMFIFFSVILIISIIVNLIQ